MQQRTTDSEARPAQTAPAAEAAPAMSPVSATASRTGGAARTKGRSRVKRLAIVCGVLMALAVGLVLVVRWSVAEHDRLMRSVVEAPEGVRRTNLFSFEELPQYRLYRTPAIVRTKLGDLLVFVEARVGKSDRGRIAIAMRRSCDNGASWSELHAALPVTPKGSYASPAPIVDRATGTIWLAHRYISRSQSDRGRVQRIRLVKSTDEGVSWSAPVDLTAAVNQAGLEQERHVGASPGHGLQLEHGEHAGRLLFAAYAGRDTKQSLARGDTGRGYAVYSDDHGKSWRFSAPTDYGGEAQMVEVANGDVLMVIRSRGLRGSKKKKRHAWSRDGGKTWEPTRVYRDLREPVCQGSLLALPKGGIAGGSAIVFLQPGGVAKGRWDKSSRKHLTVWVSHDGGKTWPVARLLHAGGASYSDMALGPRGYVHAVYETASRRSFWSGSVNLASFHPSWVDERIPVPELEEPFSEYVYDAYQYVRAPIEEWLKEEGT